MENLSFSNPYLTLLGGIFLLISPKILDFIKWISHEKNKEIKNKVDSKSYEKERDLREENMKFWVIDQISKSLEKLKIFLKSERDESEKKIYKKFEEFTNLLEKYREYNHDLRDINAQQAGTLTICNEALERAERIIRLTSSKT